MRTCFATVTYFAVLLSLAADPLASAAASVGDWPQPRQNPHLTAIQSLPGAMTDAPTILGQINVSQSRPSMIEVPSPDGAETWGLCIVGGALYCFNTQGNPMWVSHPPGLNFTAVVAAEDLDGDGQIEIALKAGRAADPYSAAVLVALDDGRFLWRYDVEPVSYAWYMVALDLFPGRTSKQIVVLMQGYPPDPGNGYITLFDFVSPGEPPTQLWRYDFHDYTAFPTLLRSDLDNDGWDELAVQTHSRMWLLDSVNGAVKQFIGWDVSPANSRSYGLVKFVDLNHDGREDFLCVADFSHHHEVLLNQNGKLKLAWVHGWPDETVNRKIVSTWPESPHADVDGDGRLEVIVSMYNSEERNQWLVRIYDAVTGALKYKLEDRIAMAVLDADGDGVAEIAVNRSTDPTQSQYTGAELVRLKDGVTAVVWENANAVFSKPNAEPTGREFRYTWNGVTYKLVYDAAKGWIGRSYVNPPFTGADWSKVPSILGTKYPTLLAADVTGDRRNEILIYSEPTLSVYALDETGKTTLVDRYDSDGLPAIADMDGDGFNEIVTGQVSLTEEPIVEARTPALQNRVLWRSVYPPPTRSGLPWASRPFYVCTGRFTGRDAPDVYVWAGIPLVRSTVLNGLTGEIVWEKGETTLGRYWGPTHQPAAVYDYNADGADDLVMTIPDYYCVCNGRTGQFLKSPAFPPTVFNQPSQGLYTFTSILERDSGDPTVCLAGGHYFLGAMSIKAAPLWYRIPLVGENRYAPEGFLRTFAGDWLLGIGRQNGRFGCVNVIDGSARWEFDSQAFCAEPCTMDVDGDGRYEFVLATSHSELIAVGDENGAPRVVWRTPLPSGSGFATYPAGVFSPIAADVNDDGKSEIIVPCFDGRVYILGAPKISAVENAWLHEN